MMLHVLLQLILKKFFLMKKTKIILLGCGSSLGVPRIDGYWGRVDKKNKKNQRMRCSLFIKYKDMNILIDTSPDLSLIHI